MKRTLLTLLAVSGLATAAAPALAQAPWVSIDQRQANIDAKIDENSRNGLLTRAEADRLRGEFRDIARLEANYRASAPGLTIDERVDLDHRFDRLQSQVYAQSRDNQVRPNDVATGPWTNINGRQRDLDARIDAGVRSGQLTRAEADRLREQFREIARIEASYRASAPGLTFGERADLDRRFDALSNQIYAQAHDDQTRGWRSIADRMGDLRARIDRSLANHKINWREARNLRNDLNALVQREHDYRASRPGLTDNERRDLDRRADVIVAQLREDRRS